MLEDWNEPNDCGCSLGLSSTPGEALLEIHRQSLASKSFRIIWTLQADHVRVDHQEARGSLTKPPDDPLLELIFAASHNLPANLPAALGIDLLDATTSVPGDPEVGRVDRRRVNEAVVAFIPTASTGWWFLARHFTQSPQ